MGLQGAGPTELAFWTFAVFGTLFFFLRVLAMVVGGLGADDLDDGGADAPSDAIDVDADLDADGDLDHPPAQSHAHGHPSDGSSSTAAFKLLSVHSVTGFFMMFGWCGLTALKQFQLGGALSFLVAAAGGTATMYLTAWLFKVALNMAAPGAAYTAKDAVGQDATVYLQIPEGGRGKVQLPVDNITRFFEAVSDDGTPIDSFKNVRIVRAMDARTVAVRRKD